MGGEEVIKIQSKITAFSLYFLLLPKAYFFLFGMFLLHHGYPTMHNLHGCSRQSKRVAFLVPPPALKAAYSFRKCAMSFCAG